jgi:tetratricopeptide (TPR) repeat protein
LLNEIRKVVSVLRLTNKKLLYLIFAAVGIMVIALCSSVYAQDTVKVHIISEPEGAIVAVNRQIRGVTPITLELNKGKNLVRVSMDENWQPYVEERELTDDQTIHVTLVPRVSFLYRQARKEFEAGAYEAAGYNFKRVISGTPELIIPESFFYVAMLDRMNRNNSGYEENLRKYIEMNPPRGEFIVKHPAIHPESRNYAVHISHFLLGNIYRERSEYGLATTAYKLAIPERMRFIDRSIESTFANIEKFKKLVEENSQDYAAKIQLAYLYELKGMLKESMQCYKEGAYELFHQSPDFINKMGKYLEK